MMIYNNPSVFTGTSKSAAIIEHLKADKLEKRFTLGLRVIRAVYKVDGVFGFYRGLLSSCALYAPSSMMFWGSYYNVLAILKKAQRIYLYRTEDVKNMVSGQSSTENPRRLLMLQAISGAFAGVAAAIVTNPLEILRIRVQVHRTSYYETLRRLYVHEGVAVFTKGLPPRMISNGLYSCLIMMAYETVKRASVLPEYKVMMRKKFKVKCVIFRIQLFGDRMQLKTVTLYKTGASLKNSAIFARKNLNLSLVSL